MGSRDLTQVVKLGGSHFYPLLPTEPSRQSALCIYFEIEFQVVQPGLPTPYVAGLEILILLPPPSVGWDYRWASPCLTLYQGELTGSRSQHQVWI